MTIGDLAEYKELMLIAKEQGNTDEYKKFYEIFVLSYKDFTGKDFEEEMKNML